MISFLKCFNTIKSALIAKFDGTIVYLKRLRHFLVYPFMKIIISVKLKFSRPLSALSLKP